MRYSAGSVILTTRNWYRMADGILPKRRNSLRYSGFDYAQPSCVFITLSTHHRQHLFGRIESGQMLLSAPRQLATDLWHRVPEHYPAVILDSLVIMPDHLHANLFLGANPEAKFGAPSLSDIVKWYKVTAQSTYSAKVRAGLWAPYRSHLWQRGFYDRIIRSDHELDAIRQYIEANPARWQARLDGMPWP